MTQNSLWLYVPHTVMPNITVGGRAEYTKQVREMPQAPVCLKGLSYLFLFMSHTVCFLFTNVLWEEEQ